MREIGISPRFSRDKFVPLQTKQRYSTRDISGKVFLTLFFRGFVPFLSLADFVSRNKNLQVADKKSLLVLLEQNKNVYLSARNVKGANVQTISGLNTYRVLDAGVVVFAESALSAIDNILM